MRVSTTLRSLALTTAVMAVIAGGAVTAGIALWQSLQQGYRLHELVLALLLLLATAATSKFPIRFGQREIVITLDSVPLLLAAFMLSPPLAVLVALATCVWANARDLPNQRTFVDRVAWWYELATVTLAMAATSLLAHQLDSHGAVLLVPALAVCLCFELINDALIVLVLEWVERGSARQFRENAIAPASANVALPTVAVIAISPYTTQPLIAVVLLAGMMVTMYFALWIANSQQLEKRRGEHLRDTFSRYVPEALVGQHVEHMERVELGGEQCDITVLFCDIRGFTSWSENREATEIVTELNVLLTALSSAVMDSEGTLDKFTGDGLMAFWGAPVPQQDHAARACEAALEMLRRLDGVNDRRMEQGQEPFAIGVGVHSGHAVVGNVGHEERLDYTAIGDTVNLAARLEAATKDIGSVLLISHETVELLPDELRGRALRIGDISVKGRRRPVEVWALQPLRPEVELIDDAFAA